MPTASFYPAASSPAVSAAMRANTKTGTRPEALLRSQLHRAGLRFRKNLRVKTEAGAVRPDIVFTRQRVAVFVDGCFWHSCPAHGTSPKSNSRYWVPKLAGNAERDARSEQMLRSAGWKVVRVWEHEPADAAAGRVVAALRRRRV